MFAIRTACAPTAPAAPAEPQNGSSMRARVRAGLKLRVHFRNSKNRLLYLSKTYRTEPDEVAHAGAEALQFLCGNWLTKDKIAVEEQAMIDVDPEGQKLCLSPVTKSNCLQLANSVRKRNDVAVRRLVP
mmetsp:Transcript_71174/g.148840  ORF Transcript_71174/g.148840 Transcript_71174/m.148840 type:complete len:129 (-) Transcript_71174:615-1001(-)